MKNKFDIIYEDENIIAINKKAGMLTLPDRWDATKENLLFLLAEKYGRIIPTHRLDKETSGVIIFAKDEVSHSFISNQFEKGNVDKTYIAFTNGKMLETEGTINEFLAKGDRHKMKVVKNQKEGKPAITHFKVLENFKMSSLIECNIETGRMHQIRVHLAYIGYPLLVDPLYKGRDAVSIKDIKQRKFKMSSNIENPRPLISRVSLHASQIVFEHPTSKKRITIEANLPKDMRALLNQLRKWNKLN